MPTHRSCIIASMPHTPDPVPGGARTTDARLFSEDEATAFLGLIRAGAALERALDRGLADREGMGLHEFEVLLFLAGSPSGDSLRMTELRRRTPLSQSRVSRVVSGLEVRGLVRREADPSDSRAVTVVLTDQGRATFEGARPHHVRDLHENLLSILTEVEIRQLARITTKLLASAQ